MSQKEKQPRQRQRLFVDRKVQGALLVRTTSYWLYCLLTLSLMTLCWRILNSEPQPFHFYLMSLRNDFAPAAAGSLLLLPVVLVDVLRMSNRFTGPMVRVRRFMQQAVAGEHVPPITFREGDFWTGFAQDFNALTARLQQLEAQVALLEREEFEPALAGSGVDE